MIDYDEAEEVAHDARIEARQWAADNDPNNPINQEEDDE